MSGILVTGGAGYIGTSLIPVLLEKRHKVVCYDILRHGIAPVLPFFVDDGFSLITGDIRDKSKLRECLKNVDIVIHLAALVGAPCCEKNPGLADSINIQGTSILNEVRSESQIVVFASTSSVYGVVETAFMCSEETPVKPISNYGTQKARNEQMLMEKGCAIVLRLSTAFGISPRLRLDLLPNDLTYQAIHRRMLSLYEGEYRRSFLHVRDVARAFVHSIENLSGLQNEVYNVGDEYLNVTKSELAGVIRRHVEYKLNVDARGKDLEQRDFETDFSKFKETGYQALVSLDEGIAEMARCFPCITVPDSYYC